MRIERKGNPRTLLVGMYNGAAALENHPAIPEAVQRSHQRTSNSTPRCLPKRNENTCSYKKLYMNVHSNIIPNSQNVETAHTSVS